MDNKLGILFKEFEWLPAATIGERFLEYVEEMDAKLAVFGYKTETEKKQKLALFLANCGAPLRKWFGRLAVSTAETHDLALKN